MKIGNRTRLSLCQFLPLLGRERIEIIFAKYGLPADRISGGWRIAVTLEQAVVSPVLEASDGQVTEILQELARTGGAIRSQVSPKVRYDEPWADLELCLQLDNLVRAKDEYGRDLKYYVPTEPGVDSVQPVDDDLTSELKRSELQDVDAILSMIEELATEFKAGNKNACLNAARVALQTLARTIAVQRRDAHPASFSEDKWGQVIAYLRKSGFIDEAEEAGLTGVYSFISPDRTIPSACPISSLRGLAERSAFSCCYFLAKAANAADR